MVARRAGNNLKKAVQAFFESLQKGERYNFNEMAVIVGEELGINFLESDSEYAKLLEAAGDVLVEAGFSDWASQAAEALVIDGWDDAKSVVRISGGRRATNAAWEASPEGRMLQAYVLGNRWAPSSLRRAVLEVSGPSFAFNYLQAGYVKDRAELEWLLENRLEAPGAYVSGAMSWEVAKVINGAKVRFGLLTEEELEADVALKHPWLKRRS